MSDPIIIYTDGGASPNPGPGGWAAVLITGNHEKEIMGNAPHTTNNRMELTAATRALEALTRPCNVELYTDSEYLKNGITKWITNWLAKGRLEPGENQVANADLWLALYPLTQWHTVNWHWVKGHAGNELNERVDKLVHKARLPLMPTIDETADITTLYVKSSCSKGFGGWAAVIEANDDTTQFSGNAMQTTSNRMELLAAIEGLSHLTPGVPIRIITQSDYLHQGATSWIHGWKQRQWKKRDGEPVSNADLWQQLDTMLATYKPAWVNARGQTVAALDAATKMAQEAVKNAKESVAS